HPFKEKNYPIEWRNTMELESMEIKTNTNAFSALYYLFKNQSYNVARFHEKAVEERIKNILDKQQFDVVLLESIYLLPYLHLFKEKGLKVILRTHNVEHQIWSSLAKNTTFLPKKWYLNKLAEQLKQYELEKCQEVDGIVSITENDARFFEKINPAVKTTSIPPIITTKAEEADYNLSDFYFLGAMDWQPNIEGIQWFIQKVIPEGLTETQFYLAGKSLNKNEYKHPGIVNLGEIENAMDFIKAHGICLIPLHSGSGLKIKLLENMALGKPIITTTEGARGVGVQHEKEVLIADHPDDFRKQMNKLSQNKELRQSLGNTAKTFVTENFNKEKLTEKLIEFIRNT
ncbi:MAG TPA: glycosyltransferase family 4 protein, partial [Brumimicrobium sp.]|nr:glycosyltransferase family 4 protein [Brumimicrobium sp.]